MRRPDARATAAAGPKPSSDSEPVQPGRMVTGAEPAASAVLTTTGEVTVPKIGLTAIGRRSVRPSPLVSISAPNAHWFSGASLVRVNVTVTVCVCPGEIRKSATSAAAVNPDGATTDTVQRVSVGSIDRNVRVVESLPASRLNVIDGRFRSLGRFFGMSPATIAGSRNSRYWT